MRWTFPLIVRTPLRKSSEATGLTGVIASLLEYVMGNDEQPLVSSFVSVAEVLQRSATDASRPARVLSVRGEAKQRFSGRPPISRQAVASIWRYSDGVGLVAGRAGSRETTSRSTPDTLDEAARWMSQLAQNSHGTRRLRTSKQIRRDGQHRASRVRASRHTACTLCSTYRLSVGLVAECRRQCADRTFGGRIRVQLPPGGPR